MRRRAFTLIELLVVIAIIAILAAILFPVFSRARESARKSACMSNLKQIAQAIQMYTQDWDEMFPYANWGHFNTGDPAYGNQLNPFAADWVDGIYPYLKNTGIFGCPSVSPGQRGGAGVCDFIKQRNPAFAPNIKITYGYSEPIAMNCNGKASLAAIKYPAESFIVGESTCHWLGGYWNDQKFFFRRTAFADGYGCGCPPSGAIPPNPDDHTYHSGGANIGFADGHVKWMKWDQLFSVMRGGTLRYGSCEL